MENFDKRGGAEQISVGAIGTGDMVGMHARNLHYRAVGAKVAREGPLQRLPPTERPILYGNEGSRVIW